MPIGSQCSSALWPDDSTPGSCLEIPKVLGLMSWADLPPGQCSPRGGNPGSCQGLKQLATEVDSENSESQEQFSVPWAFPASILFYRTPRGGQDSFHILVPLLLRKSFLLSDLSPSSTQVSMEFSEEAGRGGGWGSSRVVGVYPRAWKCILKCCLSPTNFIPSCGADLRSQPGRLREAAGACQRLID